MFVLKINVEKSTVTVADSSNSQVKINGVDCSLFDGKISKIAAFRVVKSEDLSKFTIGQDLSKYIEFGPKSDPDDDESSLYSLKPVTTVAGAEVVA